MNETKVRKLINQLITEQQNFQVTRKQYPIAKHQIAKLEKLDILHLMPEKFGYTDAAVVIEAATSGKQTFVTAHGEGEEAPAHPLFVAINEADGIQETFYEKSLNASLDAPILTAVVKAGKVVHEFVYQKQGNYRDGGAPWGLIGLTLDELKSRGFTKRAEYEWS